MRVRQVGQEGFMVEMPREPEFALYATKWMPGPRASAAFIGDAFYAAALRPLALWRPRSPRCRSASLQ